MTQDMKLLVCTRHLDTDAEMWKTVLGMFEPCMFFHVNRRLSRDLPNHTA